MEMDWTCGECGVVRGWGMWCGKWMGVCEEWGIWRTGVFVDVG